MGHKNTLHALLEMEGESASDYFQSFMRMSTRLALSEIMKEEVNLLCGLKHSPDSESKNYRAGSESGVFYDEGKKKAIRRPRVRDEKGEVHLKTYSLAHEIENISDEIIRAIENGVSTRAYSKLKDEKTISKSEVSRLWIEKGVAKIEELRSRDFTKDQYFCLMLDGICLSPSLMGIVALGITESGEKHILDFNIGSSENFEVCNDLVKKIVARGFKSEGRLYCVLDGSSALQKAVLNHYPDAVIQRCIIHKERNICGYLSYKDQGECKRLMTRIRKAQGEKDAREAFDELSCFLKSKNISAYNSLEESGDQLISLHILGVPSTLNTSLLNTNIIENTMRNIRRTINRNNRWRPETTQPDRWLAAGLLYSEKGFRKIKGFSDIPKLLEALKDKDIKTLDGTPSRAEPV